jgi:ABC-type transporter Mla subunit MlaD
MIYLLSQLTVQKIVDGFEMVQFAIDIGVKTRDFVIWVANLLTQDYTPGLIAALLLVILLGSLIYCWLQFNKRLNALRWFSKIINDYDTPQSFTASITDVDQKILEKKDNKHFVSLVAAWREYRETLVLSGEGHSRHLRNSVRPSTFFNVEDLGYGPKFWRIVPGLFVTVGLFLTFLGLVAALSAMNVGSADPTALQKSLDNLLKAASAKFIMSLTGLFCSIIFTVVLRSRIESVETLVHKICSKTEFLLKFISLEDIANNQLQAIKEQREHFRSIGLELVAEFGRPLREELPNSISQSITQAMAPIMERVNKIGSDGVGSMVEDLSQKFSNDVSGALEKASESIEKAGRKIGDLATRMDQSSGNMNEQLMSSIASLGNALEKIQQNSQNSATKTTETLEQGSEQLLLVMSESLQGIRENTSQGAEAIKEAAAEMRASAETFRDTISNATQDGSKYVKEQLEKTADSASGAINTAGNTVLQSFGITAERISEISNNFSTKMSEELIEPIITLSEKFGNLSREISSGTTQFSKLTDSVKTGSEATVNAALTLKTASNNLALSAEPIRSTIENIERAVTKLENSTNQTASIITNGVQSTIKSADQALKTASTMLQGEQSAVESVINGLNEVVKRLQGQGDKLDQLDTKLGSAFESYALHTEKALDLMQNHVRKMQEELTPALDTMREIVEQAEKFIPQSRVRN